MKLTKEQIKIIETYLNRKELVQIDVKTEVLDHMANAIENKIASEELTFETAFKIQILKWDKELSNYSSPMIGLLFSGPRLMILKCVKELKTLYVKTVFIGLLLSAILFALTFRIETTSYINFLKTLIGLLFFLGLFLIITLYFLIKRTKIKSSYSYMFKAQALGVGVFYLLYNPLIADMFGFYNEDGFLFVGILAYSILLAFSYQFISLYRAHSIIVKMTKS